MDEDFSDSENNDLLERLTPSQVEAVKHRDAPYPDVANVALRVGVSSNVEPQSSSSLARSVDDFAKSLETPPKGIDRKSTRLNSSHVVTT